MVSSPGGYRPRSRARKAVARMFENQAVDSVSQTFIDRRRGDWESLHSLIKRLEPRTMASAPGAASNKV